MQHHKRLISRISVCFIAPFLKSGKKKRKKGGKSRTDFSRKKILQSCVVPPFYAFVFLSAVLCVLQPCLEMTGTFKMKKVRLVEEGFDPAHISDPVYFLEPQKKTYVRLTEDIHAAIVSREMKL